jgi:hypothetical protein
MNHPTPPPSDAIALPDHAIARAYRESKSRVFNYHEEVEAFIDKRAREIAAQPGEGEPTCWRYRWKDDDGDWLPWQMIGQATVDSLRANKDPARYELQALYASPPHLADALDGWIEDGDTLRADLIESAREAICMEFGNNGTDGYYKRILVRVFKSLKKAIAARAEAGDQTNKHAGLSGCDGATNV